MPIYKYLCPKCNRSQEQIHKMDGTPDACDNEDCAQALTLDDKQLTSAGFAFQAGEGWGGWQESGPDTVSRERD